MKLKLKILNILSWIPDEYFNTILFCYKNGYWPNLENPRSFNEKINYIKLNSKNKMHILAADRLKVRDYVKKKAPKCKIIPLLWHGKHFGEDVYNNLPEKFVIKASHGSGMVFVGDKNKHNYMEIYQNIKNWLSIDYGRITRQHFYTHIEREYIVEKFLDVGSEILPDYKFMCLNGKVEFVQVDLDRFIKHKRNIYDKNFKRINIRYEFQQGEDIGKPILYEDAKRIAEKLSIDFDLIRVDLYITDNEIYFGELTNTPDNGLGRFYPKRYDFELGQKLIFKKEF